MQAEASSLKKGESLLDTVHTLDAMKPDCLVMRHAASGAPEFVARHLEIPVINAGDGTHEHPSQGLLDALTIRDRKGTIENLQRHDSGRHQAQPRGAFEHSSAGKIRLQVHAVRAGDVGSAGVGEHRTGAEREIRRVFRIEEALEDADVVLALRVQNERLHEPALSLNDYILLYQLSAERMRHAKADAIVLHPGPLNRGIEITPEVADSPQSCVLEQVTNGIAVRMALLFLLAAGGSEDDGQQAETPRHATGGRLIKKMQPIERT